MKKTFINVDEAERFIKDLVSEEKYVINIQPTNDTIQLEWQEHKSYETLDGKTFPDEVWITQDNRMFLVQDLEPDHCRNILRMLLRQERMAREKMEDLANHVSEIMADMETLEDDTEVVPANTVLH